MFAIALVAPTAAFSQEVKSEDQFIAEALWAQVVVGFDRSNADEILAEAKRKHPQSPKVAYWQGRLGVRQQGIAEFGKLLMKTIDSISEAAANEALNPAVRNRLAVGQVSAMKMFAEAADQFAKANEAQETAPFEIALMDAVRLDPKFSAAWAALLESRNTKLAIAAADAWAAVEPDNALPLYAKAVILNRDRAAYDSPIADSVIAAIEKGNQLTECRVPSPPFPRKFRLVFPRPFNEAFPGIEGEAVPQAFFREMVENGFNQFEAIGNWSTVSESELRNLMSGITYSSVTLPPAEEARRLLAAVGIGQHMANSNQHLFGMTQGAVDRSLIRLETLAVTQGDFAAARTFREIANYMNETRALVIQGYRDSPARSRPERTKDNWRTTVLGAELDDDDERATKIMKSRAAPPELPILHVKPNEEDSPLVIRYDESQPDSDLVLIDVVESKDNNIHADWHGDKLSKWLEANAPRRATSAGDLTSEELQKIGIPVLDDRIAEIQRDNRNNGRSRGFFFVSRDKYVNQSLANACFFAGYRNQRDHCVIAFQDGESLNNCREWYAEFKHLRLAQMLGPGELLSKKAFDEVADQADSIAVPLDRVLTSTGEISEMVVESRLPIYVMLEENRLDGVAGVKKLKKHKSIAGWIFFGP